MPERKTSLLSSRSQTKEPKELPVGGTLEGQKLQETSFTKDQNYWLPVADEASYPTLWRTKRPLIRYMVSGHLIPCCTKRCGDMSNEGPHRRYVEFFKWVWTTLGTWVGAFGEARNVKVYASRNNLSQNRNRQKNVKYKTIGVLLIISLDIVQTIPIGRVVASKCASRIGYYNGAIKWVESKVRQLSDEFREDREVITENGEGMHLRVRSRVCFRPSRRSRILAKG